MNCKLCGDPYKKKDGYTYCPNWEKHPQGVNAQGDTPKRQLKPIKAYAVFRDEDWMTEQTSIYMGDNAYDFAKSACTQLSESVVDGGHKYNIQAVLITPLKVKTKKQHD